VEARISAYQLRNLKITAVAEGVVVICRDKEQTPVVTVVGVTKRCSA
jgi:hypothetical protein